MNIKAAHKANDTCKKWIRGHEMSVITVLNASKTYGSEEELKVEALKTDQLFS